MKLVKIEIIKSIGKNRKLTCSFRPQFQAFLDRCTTGCDDGKNSCWQDAFASKYRDV